MRKLNYKKLMAAKPTKLDEVINQKGQNVTFYEHPVHGDQAEVIAVFHKVKAAFNTEFWDTDDFFKDSDYNPILQDDGTCLCAWEVFPVEGN